MKLAVHFGAGNIGRGFIAPTLQANNYEVIFVDVNTDLIEQINSEGQYSIKSLSLDGISHEEIKDIKAVNLNDSEQLKNNLLNADLITTSVGPKFVEGVYEKVATLNHKRNQTFIAFENMYKASSTVSAETTAFNENLKIIDAVVDKIVPPQPTTSLDVIVETHGSIILDDSTDFRPLEASEIVSYSSYENEFYKKLWLLNGLHLQLAYYGLYNGQTFIDEVILSSKGRVFAENAVASLSDAYKLLSKSDEDLTSFSELIIKRFSLSEIKDQVSRIARNPEIKFAKGERFEYPLQLLVEGDKNIDTFKQVFDILFESNFHQVDGFMNFKDSILNKGKTKLYSEYWDVVTDTYIEKLGA
jgi:mannitol-1-phosphate 5-dehydrogenase